MASVERTYDGRTFVVRARITAGSPGTYFDPPDPDEVDDHEAEETTEGGDALEGWDAFLAFLEQHLGAEGAANELGAIDEALIAVAYDDLAAGSDWP